MVRLASVRGYAHRYYGSPRQDDAVVAVHESGVLVFAVADGVSAARMSHVGAAGACRASIDAMLAELDRGPARVDWAEVVRAAASAVPDQAMATTLLCGTARRANNRAQATLVRVGDSNAWRLHERQFDSLINTGPAAGDLIVSTSVAALPDVPAGLAPIEVTLGPADVLLVGTDGFGDPLGDGTGLVGNLFADALATPPPPLGFAQVLDFSRESFDDDRTLVAVWLSAKP
ncbi:protein phosphatase 2C domain-containing protein [Micromonospora chalcea]|uniref:protein phosphatase 2C domain-containing protein n=1 Tax=Micromonospora chalcea TaxID=1874 RepID=UPI0033ECE6FD